MPCKNLCALGLLVLSCIISQSVAKVEDKVKPVASVEDKVKPVLGIPCTSGTYEKTMRLEKEAPKKLKEKVIACQKKKYPDIAPLKHKCRDGKILNLSIIQVGILLDPLHFAMCGTRTLKEARSEGMSADYAAFLIDYENKVTTEFMKTFGFLLRL